MTGKRNETLTTDLKYPMVVHRLSDAAYVLQHTGGMVSPGSHWSVVTHGTLDERT